MCNAYDPEADTAPEGEPENRQPSGAELSPAYILHHPLWGWLCIPDYTLSNQRGLWSADKNKAFHFFDIADALKVRDHWPPAEGNEDVEITIEEEAR